MSRFYNLDQAPFNSRELSKAIVAAIAGQYDGAFFDAQDMSTMFQDAAGTTPVTAMEQPVGLWLDKSQGVTLGPELKQGYSLVTLGTPTQQPTYNPTTGVGFSYRTDGSNAGGVKFPVAQGKTYLLDITILSGSATLRSNSIVGTVLFNPITASTILRVYLPIAINGALYIGSATNASGCEFRVNSIRELKGNHATQSVTASRPVVSAKYNVLLGTDSPVTQSVTASGVPATLSFYGTGSVTLSGAYAGTLNGTGADNRVSLNFTPTAASLTLTISGSITKIMLHNGSSLLPYQRVNTATDYDTVGFKKYMKFDGVDDYLNLPFLWLYLNGSASIVAARDALSQAVDTFVVSETSTANVNPKYFPSRQLANAGNMDAYIVNDAGTVVVDTVGSAYGGASDAVVRSVIDSGDNIKLFKNGALAANDNYTRSGTLTLTNTTIGASVSTTTSNYANMKLYGLAITKSALSDSERRRVERLLAYNSGAQI